MRPFLYCLFILSPILSLNFLLAQSSSQLSAFNPTNELCFLEEFNDVTTGNNTSSSGSNSSWAGNVNFPIVNYVYQAGGAIRLGTTTEEGSITSKILDEISGNTTLKFDVKGWTEVEGDLTITLGGILQTVSYSAVMSEEFESITLHFAEVPPNSTLTISTSNKRAFLDNIQLICNTFSGAHTDFYRSRQTGAWNDFNSWESSSTGLEGTYTPSFLYPNAQAKEVIIQPNHQITINSPHLELTNLEVYGTVEITGSSTYSVLGDDELEVRIKNGGIFLVNSNGTNPDFEAKGIVESGGKVIAGPQMGGGTAFGNRYIGVNTGFFSFEDGSIVEWDNPNTVLGSTTTIDRDFFRRTSENALPIFRILTKPGFSFGSDSNNVLNCILEVVEPAEFGFRFSGEKTILGGIQGTGLIFQEDDSGNLFLGNGTNFPFLDGNITLSVQDFLFKFPNGAEIKENAQIKIESAQNIQNHRLHRIAGNLEIKGSLDIHNLRIQNSSDGRIRVYDGGEIRTRHTGGLFGSNAAIVDYANGKLLLEEGSTVDYYADETQAISSLMNYYHLIFSGNGLKNPNSSIGVHTNGSVQIYDNPIVNFSNHNLGLTTGNDTQFFMEGGRLILGTGGSQPNMNGNYELLGGTIEFTGNSEIRIRVGSNFNPKMYRNILISGTNIKAGFTEETGLSFYEGGSFRVNDHAIFKVPNQNGFVGTTTSAIKNAEVLSELILDFHSTIDYNRDDGNFQSVSVLENGYGNLKISGSGIKSQTDKYLIVQNTTQISGGEFIIPTSTNEESPFVLEAKRGIQNLGGSVVFENNANLMQEIGAINSGEIELKRKAIVPDIQYNFWSSPVGHQPLYALYPDIPTNRVMVYNTATDFYTILPTSTNPLSEFGIGYSIKGSSSMQPEVTSTFTGTPNNESLIGTENAIPLSTLGRNFNLIGNPFPSNLDLVALYQENQDQFYDDNQEDTPHFLFWDNTDNDDLIQQGPDYVNQNFALFNPSAQLGIPAPRFGSTGKMPNGIIRPGQGFIMRADESATELILKNTMRTTEIERNNIHSEYFRNDNFEEKNHFFLSLTTPSKLKILIAIAYFEKAENSFERFDSKILTENSSENFYSISSDSIQLVIQGKKLPFQKTDEIPLGIKTVEFGKCKIELMETEGIFQEISILLYDRILNIYHDLQSSDYDFVCSSGEFQDRYSILFQPKIQRNFISDEWANSTTNYKNYIVQNFP